MFNQILVPEHNLGITVLLALVPLIVLLCLLAVFRVTAWLSTLIASIVTVLIAVWVWGAPFSKTVESYVFGSLQGGWSINWITLWGVVIFNTLVVTGNFDRFQKWMVRHATADSRIQTVMLASAFGAILERLVGCGYLWAGVSRLREGLAMPDRGAIRVAPLP